MAKKLFLVCSTLALCFLLTNASIYRTVVEFDEDEAINHQGGQGQGQKCQREFQQAQQLRACQQWIRQQARQGRGGGSSFDDEFDIMNERQLQQCCNELQQVDQECVCPTLQQAARSVRIQEQQGGQSQARQIFQAAKHLPTVCNIPQVGVCPFRATPYF